MKIEFACALLSDAELKDESRNRLAQLIATGKCIVQAKLPSVDGLPYAELLKHSQACDMLQESLPLRMHSLMV
eukprot:5274868-Amphidinium_carterae.2